MAASEHLETSISVSGVDNGATYLVGVRAGNSAGWGGWRNSEPAGPWTPPPPPAAPSSVSVERSDEILDVSWPAVAGATSYHVTYTSDSGQSWSLAALNHPTAGIAIDGVENADTYVVAVRARNAGGWGGWTNSSAAGPWLPPPPAAVSSVAVARAPGTLDVSWPAPDGATSYHVTYTADGGKNWLLAAFDHPTASIAITGVQNGDDYIVGVRARNAGGWSGWTNSSVSSAYDPPAAPGSLAVKPGDGYLDLSWDAVSGATGYDVRAKAEGADSWHSVAGAVTATSFRYTTDATIDHVAVRARNAGGAGPWAEKSRMPSEDLWTAVTGDTVGGESGAEGLVSAASAQPLSGKLGSPSWGTITRDGRRIYADEMEVNWTAVAGADGYNIVCSNYGWYWDVCGWQTGDSSNPVSYDTVPTTQGQPLTISHYWRKEGWGTPGKYPLTIGRGYTVAIRAVKTGDPSTAGPWVRSETTHTALPLDTFTFAYTRSDGEVTMTWGRNPWVTGYEIDCGVYEPGQTTVYTLCATLADVDHRAAQHTATVSSWTDSGTNYSIDNTKTYDIRIISTNKWSSYGTLVPLMDPITLTASRITATSATLTLDNYTGNWWLKPTAPADATCETMGAATAVGSVAVASGLTPSHSYTYKAYSDSACTNEIVSETFSALSYPSVSNLTEQDDGGVGFDIYSGGYAATKFTTGGSENGYTVKSATVKINSVEQSAGNLTVAIHAVSSGNPATSATIALSGSNPTGAGESTFTCSSSCTLAANTDYFLVLKGTGATNSNAYTWSRTLSNTETNSPSNLGWSIADAAKTWNGSTWSDDGSGFSGMFKLSAQVNTVLTVSDVTGSGAKLTIDHQHVASWYYKATTGPHTTCQGPVSTDSVTLTGLSAAASYTYSAYSDSTCTNANLLATATEFTTPLSAPTGLSWSVSPTPITVGWNKPADVSGAVGYDVQWQAWKQSIWQSAGTVASTSDATVSFTINSGAGAFRVRADLNGTKSAWAEYAVTGHR